MQKQSFFIILLYLFCLMPVKAQDVRVLVNCDGEEVPNSYIFINGKIQGASDTNGVYILRKNLLQKGDTISARYVGSFGKVIYDGSKDTKDYIINIEPLSAGNVIFTPDVYELYRKYVKPPKHLIYRDKKFDCTFTIKAKTDSTDYDCTGNISVCIESLSHNFRYKILDINTSEEIADFTYDIIRSLRNGIAIVHFSKFEHLKPGLQYHGIYDGNRVFSYPYYENDIHMTQLYIHADKNKYYVNKFRTHYFYDEASDLDAEIQCDYVQRKRGKEIVLNSLECYYKSRNHKRYKNREYNLSLSVINVSPHIEIWDTVDSVIK